MRELQDMLYSPEGICAMFVAQTYYKGAKITDYLGGGSCGKAFLMDNNMVIKITAQYREYNFNKTLVGKKIDHVNEIYRCIHLRHELYDYYAIIQKYVDTHKYYEEIEWMYNKSDAVRMVKDYLLFGDDTRSNEQYDYSVKHIKSSFDEEDRPDFIFLLNQMRVMMKKLKHEARYRGTDFNFENQGWDEERKQLVMIDLGYSDSDVIYEEEPIEVSLSF